MDTIQSYLKCVVRAGLIWDVQSTDERTQLPVILLVLRNVWFSLRTQTRSVSERNVCRMALRSTAFPPRSDNTRTPRTAAQTTCQSLKKPSKSLPSQRACLENLRMHEMTPLKYLCILTCQGLYTTMCTAAHTSHEMTSIGESASSNIGLHTCLDKHIRFKRAPKQKRNHELHLQPQSQPSIKEDKTETQHPSSKSDTGSHKTPIPMPFCHRVQGKHEESLLNEAFATAHRRSLQQLGDT